jgi:hypothetical protein
VNEPNLTVMTLPDGWQYLDHVAVVKALRDDGTQTIFFSQSQDLPDWEALGMAKALTSWLDDEVASAFGCQGCENCE